MANITSVENTLKNALRRSAPAVVGVVLIGVMFYPYASPASAKHSPPPKSTSVKKAEATVKPKTFTQTPAASTTPSTPVAVTTPAATSSPAVTTSSQPAPVVTPAPDSSVNSLTPTTPPSDPSGSSGSGSSSPPPSSGQSSPPTQTTGYTSTNWSGYLAANGNFTTVSGSWTATSPTSNGSSTSADATWIGIGGVTSDDLIQIGTSNTVSRGGHVSAEAFYELLPNVSQTVPGVTVTPGDSMNASINETSPGQWTFYIIDQTNSQSYTSNVSYTSTNSSAEWIEEDPSFSNNRQIPFDNFGSTSFTGTSMTMNSLTLNLTGANAQPITMVSSRTGAVISKPSAIGSDGSSFSVSQD